MPTGSDPDSPTTYVYKRADGCDICADLYMPSGAASKVPVLLYVAHTRDCGGHWAAAIDR